MSTLKVTHLQNENGTGPAMSIAVGGGVTFAGITTFHDRVKLGTETEGHVSADDLTIDTSGDTGMTIRSGTSSQGSIYFSDATSGAGEYAGWLRYSHSLNDMTVGTASGTRVTVTSGGDVGINDTDPNFKLDVNGDIGIREGNNLVWHDASGTAAFRIRAGSDNILHFERASGNDQNLTINDGKLGIGTANPEGTIHTLASINNHLVLESSDSNADIIGADTGGSTRIRSSGGQLSFYTNGDASAHNAANSNLAATINTSGNLVFPSGKGIDFSATGDGSGVDSSELLDDYEEGTWTPSYNGALTIVSPGHSIQYGTYTKIGDFVFVFGRCTVPASSINATTSSTLGIDGFPYAFKNHAHYYPTGRGYGDLPNNAQHSFVIGFPNQTAAYFYKDTGDSYSAISGNSVGSSNQVDFLFSITYQTN